MTKEIQRYVDAAMYAAEPLKADEGPKVYLLSMSPDPLGTIAACAKIYRGEVVRHMSEITDAERVSYFEDMQRTALDAAFETVQFHFLLEGVTRAFTHQLVRQRMGAVYFQESLRFAVKEDMREGVALPPSLAGTADHAVGGVPEGHSELDDSEAQKMRDTWDMAVGRIQEAYLDLINAGMPAEDARGLLPHAQTTRVHYVVNLRALKMHSGLRLCTQAQAEWRQVWAGIVQSINGKNILRDTESTNDEDMVWTGASPDQADGINGVWMADKLAALFRPVCYQTGACQFEASFDRYCSIRERVQEHAKAGTPSSEWSNIAPVEWLANPNAARKPQ